MQVRAEVWFLLHRLVSWLGSRGKNVPVEMEGKQWEKWVVFCEWHRKLPVIACKSLTIVRVIIHKVILWSQIERSRVCKYILSCCCFWQLFLSYDIPFG